MKKIKMMALAAMIGLMGCTTTPPDSNANTDKAYEIGELTAVVWLIAEKPSDKDITTARNIISYIDQASTNNISVSYYDTLYPYAQKYINDKVDEKDKILALYLSKKVLNKLDEQIPIDPSWLDGTGEATKIVKAFCSGFASGLDIDPTDSTNAVVKAASKQIE